MAILETLFLIIIISTALSMIKANDDTICPTSNCGSLSISYPFKLHNSQTQDNCSHIDLKCNDTTGTAITNIPHVGDFYVSNIYYDDDDYDPLIILHETRDCLMMKSLISNNFTLSLSPFDSEIYFNYTFYSCSSYPNATDIIYEIDCLSSPGNVTLAVDSFLSLNVTDDCRKIGSSSLPISMTEVGSDIFLTWKPMSCPSCEKSSPRPGDTDDQEWQPPNISDNSMHETYLSQVFVVIAVTITVCSMLIARIMIKKDGGNELPVSGVAMAAPPQPVAGGLDEAGIGCCTELLVVSESFISCGSDANACPICLESFKPPELSRSIQKCGHCFHDECVVPWLIVNGTCPVCRIIINSVG